MVSQWVWLDWTLLNSIMLVIQISFARGLSVDSLGYSYLLQRRQPLAVCLTLHFTATAINRNTYERNLFAIFKIRNYSKREKRAWKISYGITLCGPSVYFYESYCEHYSCGNSVIRRRKRARNWDGPEARPDAFMARDPFISRLAQRTPFNA